MDNIPDGHCNKCLPDCSTTLYHASVTAAPFRRCDYKNLGISHLCDFDLNMNPPIWGQQVLEQYKDETSEIPNYIKQKVKSQFREFAGNFQIQNWVKLPIKSVSIIFQTAQLLRENQYFKPRIPSPLNMMLMKRILQWLHFSLKALPYLNTQEKTEWPSFNTFLK